MYVASDVEGTLTEGATWKGFARYLQMHGLKLNYRVFLAIHLPGALLARRGLIDEQSFRNRWMVDMARFFRGKTASAVQQIADWIVEQELWPKRRSSVVAELERYRDAGHQVILSSGMYQPVLESFAKRLGAIPLGSALEVRDGTATGRIAGLMNNGITKAESLRVFLKGAVLDAAYGDTAPDIPMLEMGKTAVAVFPDAALRQAATERGWRILESQG